MAIRSVTLTRFRNILDQTLELGEPGRHQEYNGKPFKFVVVAGDNGSGKSSLVEAVYLLCRGRSFRSPELNKLITVGEDQFSVFGRFDSQVIGGPLSTVRVGIGKRRTQSLAIRVDNIPVVRSSELAYRNPTLLITPERLNLLSGTPSDRRQFLDWGVFHVKHQFGEEWRKWQSALRQRNALLKLQQSSRFDGESRRELAIWTRIFCDASQTITDLREEYIVSLQAVLRSLDPFQSSRGAPANSDGETFGPDSCQTLQDLSITLNPGFRRDLDLLDQLNAALERDIKLGFTSIGPQKADLLVRVNGRPAIDFLSRGQQKKSIIYLYYAQILLSNQNNTPSCIVLIDDFGSELDSVNQSQLLRLLAEENCQVVITLLSCQHARDVASVVRSAGVESIKMFHVKQGVFSEMKD